MTSTEVGNRVRQHRESARMTQRDLYGPLGMSRPTYIEREKGRRPFTGAEIIAIARILKCQVSDLVSDVRHIGQSPSLMIAASEACRLVHQLDSGEITEGRFARSLGCDRVDARTVAELLRVAAAMVLRDLYHPNKETRPC